jgi:1-acyl-sn-glycerol-3-phosphate acyltransferase
MSGCRPGRHLATCVAGCGDVANELTESGIVAWRVVRLVCWLAVAIPLLSVLAAIPGYAQQKRRTIALQWVSRGVLTALDVRVQVIGEPRGGPSLVVANHTSWLDILVLCAHTRVVPVAKSEVAGWPVIGAMARRCGVIFIRRHRLRSAVECVDEMTLALRRGHQVQVFPEATTRCGRAVGEFYRAAFQAALNAAVVVQPAALSLMIDGTSTPAAAFVARDTVGAALWRLLRMPPVTVELRWLRPIPAIAGTGRAAVDRATVARLSQNAIARALAQPVVLRRQKRDPAPREQQLVDD